MQRIRIGVTGLAFVFLLVLLGTAIGARRDEDVAVTDNQSVLIGEKQPVAEPTEPLAELGAAPGQAAVEPKNETSPDPTIDGDTADVVVDEIERPLSVR
jgi:hypothetical protein